MNSNVTAAAPAAAQPYEQCWYYYPLKAGGPVMMRLLETDSRTNTLYCRQLQNDEGNYYFDKSNNTIYINNHRPWRSDLAVWRLPTDAPELQEFLYELDGVTEPAQQIRHDGDGLLVIVGQGKDEEEEFPQAIRHYNLLYEEYFRNWPSRAKLVDNRDAMHKRGWTYFTVAGQIDGREITGTGQLPFVYASSKRYEPWIRLSIAGKEFVDRSFTGLSRPWMGLHTIDTIRRDAAAERIPFETRLINPAKVEITLKTDRGQIIYTIDMTTDLIDTINLSTTDGREGILRFSYLQQLDETDDKFTEPRVNRYAAQQTEPGLTWIWELATKK